MVGGPGDLELLEAATPPSLNTRTQPLPSTSLLPLPTISGFSSLSNYQEYRGRLMFCLDQKKGVQGPQMPASRRVISEWHPGRGSE